MNLVYSVIAKEYPTFIHDEDIIQSGMLGLCNAADKWDEEKSKFSTYAWSAIINGIKMELRSRSKHQGVLSLDYTVNTPDGDEISFGDLIPAEQDVGMVLAEFDERGLTQVERQVFRLIKKGYNCQETADILGKSKQVVHQSLRSIRRKRG